jgi:hypothetical protein
MSDRCEPPEHLRGVDGWHWVQAPVGNPHLARWHAAERGDVEPLWTSTHHVYAETPRYVVRDWGWRYLAPVAPPDLVRELVEALEELVDVQVFATGWDNGVTDSTGTVNEGDYFHSQSMDRARAALHRAKEAGV